MNKSGQIKLLKIQEKVSNKCTKMIKANCHKKLTNYLDKSYIT